MKRNLLTLFFIYILTNIVFGENKTDSISFISQFSKTYESNPECNKYYIDSIKINCCLSQGREITIKCLADSCRKKITLANNVIPIDSGVTTATVYYIVQNDSAINTKNDWFALVLSTKDSVEININTHVVEIEEYHDKYYPENLYRFALGTNFDFADGIVPKSIYAEISTFQPDLISLTKSNRHYFKSLGIYGGLYQNRNISPDSADSKVYSFTRISLDSIFVREVFNQKPMVTLTNLGFNFGLTLHFIEGIKNDTRFNLYASVYSELIRHQEQIEYTYKTLSVDTIKLIEMPQRPMGYMKIQSRKEVIDMKYVGFGLPMCIQSKEAELNFRPYIGYRWIENKEGGTFYLFQFSLIENKYGLCLSGEYRGVFGLEESLISLNLSKLFSLSKLMEYK